jgi:pilus assembly protein CpaB
MVAGGMAAVLAGAILLFYVSQYRDSIQKEQQPVAVLVANTLIAKGTSGTIIANQSMYVISKVPTNRVLNGAITDPDALKGKVAVDDLFPGKQLTESDFVDARTQFSSKLTGYDRAVSIPLDAAHGMIGYIQPGDRVDVIAGFTIAGNDSKQHPVERTIMQNILVMDTPSGTKSGIGSSNTNQNVVLKVDDRQAMQLTYATDYGKLWLVLRAPSGSLQHTPSLQTIDTLLFGVNPVAVLNAYHRIEQQTLKGGN